LARRTFHIGETTQDGCLSFSRLCVSLGEIPATELCKGGCMEYRYLTTSLTGLIQQLACNVLPHGYWFYVRGVIPDNKEPHSIDAKLLDRYSIEISRQQRARRKLQGLANLHYLRLGRLWFIFATHGRHNFFTDEERNIRDIRKVPLQVGGYSLSVKEGGYLKKTHTDETQIRDGRMRARVQIARGEYLNLCGYFLERACHRSAEALAAELFSLPYEPYAPIRRQQLNLLRLVNKKRQMAGFEKLSPSVLRYKRGIVRPFSSTEGEEP
jgi:hypothetical protein